MKKVIPETWQAARQRGRTEPWSYVYCVAEEGVAKGPCKVGITLDINKRLCGLQSGNWRELVVVWLLRVPGCSTAKFVETQALLQFRPNVYDQLHKDQVRLQSEWVSAAPQEVLAYVLNIVRSMNDNEVVKVA